MIQAKFHIRHGGFYLEAEFTIPGKGIAAIFGPSGCGKTSLLRAIAGLERHAGYLNVNDEVWQNDIEHQFLPTYKRGVGFVFQEASLFSHLTVQNNLEFGWQRTAPDQRNMNREQMLSLLGIGHLLNRYPNSLSGGERQRVAIARALLSSPKILLMDEPLASLDLQRKQEVLPYLERLHNTLDIPILYVSHLPEEVVHLADHLMIVGSNKILASGHVSEVTAELNLPKEFYENMGVILTGIVIAYDIQNKLVKIQVGNEDFWGAYSEVVVGTMLRFRILARSVNISLSQQHKISALNQLTATVNSIKIAETDLYAMVRLNANGFQLFAKMNRHSLSRLQIDMGKRVWVQFDITDVTMLSK